METNYLFESERLGFRPWKDNDRDFFASMTADLEVMRYFPETLTKLQADQLIDRFNRHMDDEGYTMWAVERKIDRVFIGYVGLLEITMAIEGQGHAEIGWRLDKRFWKQGFATEGALACLAYAFDVLHMTAVYSFTATINVPSETVMKKIGMSKIGEFQHPKLACDSPLKTHVLYKIEKQQFTNSKG
ncbi:GNAT family N-acetyltransferase [Planococcus kocurii]|uniref:GNAT family acetyltransferase n=1 Tax=Planococcus kocurii TaxID=1374 RepID=A0ABN4JXF7_9BACL|nr:GNAT family N-acetyltransferase [Planococcus kocurii]ALS78656.1 GNAT family acetyltransferase [Planococcus kocurii]